MQTHFTVTVVKINVPSDENPELEYYNYMLRLLCLVRLIIALYALPAVRNDVFPVPPFPVHSSSQPVSNIIKATRIQNSESNFHCDWIHFPSPSYP